MNVTGSKQSSVPPGFRFHPTEEELLNYYLRKKLASDASGLDFICDIDLNKLEPWDIQEKCRIGTWAQNEWYLFSNNGKKYLYGTRTNRATASGFWKATGRDKVIRTSSGCIGLRKTLVFYQGRAPHSRKSDWIMHEYRLDENNFINSPQSSTIPYSIRGATLVDEGWVICRVFKKKLYFHNNASDNHDNNYPVTSYSSTGKLDSIGICNATPGRSSVFDISTIHAKLMQLPSLKTSNPASAPTCCDWATLDKFVADQLNGTVMPDMHAGTCDEQGSNIGDDGGLWSLI